MAKMQSPELIEEAKHLVDLAKSDEAAFKIRKSKLPAFIIGKFSYRNADGLQELSPYFCFDIDKVDSGQITEILDRLAAWEYTKMAYPSVSGMGIRLICRGEFTVGSREAIYNLAASMLSIYLGIPAEEEKKRSGVPGAYINTSTRDVSRLWYYSGMLQYRHNLECKSFKSPAANLPPAQQVRIGASESEKVEAVVSEIERRGVDITSDYDSWMRVGMSLASFGEGGRDWFHRVSRMYSGYDFQKSEKKYDNFVKSAAGKVSIATFFKFAKDSGVSVFPEHRQYDHLSPEGTKYEDPDLEASINAYISQHGDRYDELLASFPLISAKCFRDETQRAIFEAVERLSLSGRYIDIATVQSIIGPDAVASIAKKRHASLEAVVGYCQIVHNLYRKSELQIALVKAAGDVMLDTVDADDRLSMLDSDISSIASGKEVVDDSIASAAIEFQRKWIDIFLRSNSDRSAMPGLTTGIAAEDKFCGGRMPGALGVIAARPAMGKTSKMLTEVRAIAKTGVPVGVFSLEMASSELAKRLVCQEGEISNAKMKDPANNVNFATKEHEYIEGIMKKVMEMPIFIDDRSRTIRAIKAKARMWHRAKKVGAIYLENLGLIKVDSGSKNRADAIGDITSEFKALAKELNIPVVIVVQLNRSTETKGGTKRPSLHELRDSGRIEEDADWVEFIYRPEYYGINEDENGMSTKGIAEIIYAKHRDGELGTVKCEFIGDLFTFKDVATTPFTPYKHIEKNEITTFTTPEPFVPQKVLTIPSKMNDDEDIPF